MCLLRGSPGVTGVRVSDVRHAAGGRAERCAPLARSVLLWAPPRRSCECFIVR